MDRFGSLNAARSRGLPLGRLPAIAGVVALYVTLAAAPAIASSSTASGTTSVPPGATITAGQAAASSVAKGLCAKSKKTTNASIVVSSGSVSVTYQFKCADLAKAPAGTTTPSTTTPAVSSAGLVGPATSATFPPGTPGQLVVVANGPSSGTLGNTVPVVVRNNSKETVTAIEIQGAARDVSGTLVGSGSSQGVKPASIAPGGIGIGYVYFAAAPNATQFTFTTSSKPSKGAGADYFAGMQITESNETEQQQFGTLRGQIVGSIVNPLNAAVSGPISVLALCLDASGNPASTASGYAETNADLPPGGSTTFSVSFSGQSCANYLVGASGYNHAAL